MQATYDLTTKEPAGCSVPPIDITKPRGHDEERGSDVDSASRYPHQSAGFDEWVRPRRRVGESFLLGLQDAGPSTGGDPMGESFLLG